MSAATYLELFIVIDRRRLPILSNQIEEIIERYEIDIEPVTSRQAKNRSPGYRDYDKGSGHRTRLNIGDCFA